MPRRRRLPVLSGRGRKIRPGASDFFGEMDRTSRLPVEEHNDDLRLDSAFPGGLVGDLLVHHDPTASSLPDAGSHKESIACLGRPSVRDLQMDDDGQDADRVESAAGTVALEVVPPRFLEELKVASMIDMAEPVFVIASHVNDRRVFHESHLPFGVRYPLSRLRAPCFVNTKRSKANQYSDGTSSLIRGRLAADPRSAYSSSAMKIRSRHCG